VIVVLRRVETLGAHCEALLPQSSVACSSGCKISHRDIILAELLADFRVSKLADVPNKV